MLVIWSDNLDSIIPIARDFEDKLIKLVWAQRAAFMGSGSNVPSAAASAVNLGGSPLANEKTNAVVDEKAVAAIVEQKVESSKRHAGDGGSKAKSRGCSWGLSYFKSNREDVEKAGSSERPMRLLAPLYSGIAAGLSVCEYSLVIVLYHGEPDDAQSSLAAAQRSSSRRLCSTGTSLVSGFSSPHPSSSASRWSVPSSLPSDLPDVHADAISLSVDVQFFCLQMFGNLTMMYVCLVFFRWAAGKRSAC